MKRVPQGPETPVFEFGTYRLLGLHLLLSGHGSSTSAMATKVIAALNLFATGCFQRIRKKHCRAFPSSNAQQVAEASFAQAGHPIISTSSKTTLRRINRQWWGPWLWQTCHRVIVNCTWQSRHPQIVPQSSSTSRIPLHQYIIGAKRLEVFMQLHATFPSLKTSSFQSKKAQAPVSSLKVHASTSEVWGSHLF